MNAAGVAMIEVNVNQAQSLANGVDGEVPQAESVAIAGSGIVVRYTNPGETALQVRLYTAAGTAWCGALSGLGGTETLAW